MVGHSVVPVVIVFVEWLIIYKICVNNSKYVVDMTLICITPRPNRNTSVLAVPFSLTSSDAYVTIVILGFRDLLMEISVVALNNIYWP